jgi:hypothetical protein
MAIEKMENLACTLITAGNESLHKTENEFIFFFHLLSVNFK